MNYKIITDPDKLKEFIDWLPDLEFGEAYYVCLLSRSKYCQGLTHIDSDKQQIKRFTSTKEYLFEKIKQCEVELGSYYQKHNPLPQESLAIYITENPRSYEKAAKNLLKKLADLITRPYDGYNPHQNAMSEIQKACSRKVYIDFDFDIEHQFEVNERIEQIRYTLNPECCNFLITRGGFHLLVEAAKLDPILKTTWYHSIMKISGVDVRGDNMIPIPGCSQGGFTPYFLK